MLLSDRLQRYGVIGAALAVVILMALLGVTLAQDTTGTTEGRLGVPGEVVLGELFDVVGYEVVPSDVEVKVEYSGHFALEGESCGSPSAGASPGAVAPTWVTLQACSVGEGWVRLVASDTGAALDEVNVTVSEPGATGQAAQVSISSLGSSLEGGDTDVFHVRASGLDQDERYTVSTGSSSSALGFNPGCTQRNRSGTITNRITRTFSYIAYGCRRGRATVRSRLVHDGNELSTDSQSVTVTAPPTPTPTPEPTFTPTPRPTPTFTPTPRPTNIHAQANTHVYTHAQANTHVYTHAQANTHVYTHA